MGFFSFDLIGFTLYIFRYGISFFGICAYVTSVWLFRKMNEEKVEEIVSERDLLDINPFSIICRLVLGISKDSS